jgi:competence protein ComEC
MDRRGLLLIGVIFIVGTAGCIGGPDPSSADNDTDLPPAESDDLDGSLEIHAINVGQADATLIIAPSGETLLIDSGDWTDDGQTVIEYLDHHDVDRVDHLVATHAHSDHIGGHPAIIEHYETEKDGIGAVWDSGVTHDSAAYERYLDAVEDHDVTLYETHDGDEIPLEGDAVTASVLNPAA